jgi:molybdopterin-guanine dinucleotide biosynthesis protein A
VITALILAGGKATRLGGVDKTAIVVDGETIFARQVRVLAARVSEIIISVGPDRDVDAGLPQRARRHEEVSLQEKASSSGLRDLRGGIGMSAVSGRRPEKGSDPIYRTVVDAIDGAGPLAGVRAGLATCATPWMLVVAGDMPHLDGALIDRMIAAASDDVDAVGIRIDDLPEPLFCLLRVSAARPAIEQRFAEGKRKASELLTSSGLRVAWLEGVARAALTNINTPDDLR